MSGQVMPFTLLKGGRTRQTGQTRTSATARDLAVRIERLRSCDPVTVDVIDALVDRALEVVAIGEKCRRFTEGRAQRPEALDR